MTIKAVFIGGVENGKSHQVVDPLAMLWIPITSPMDLVINDVYKRVYLDDDTAVYQFTRRVVREPR